MEGGFSVALDGEPQARGDGMASITTADQPGFPGGGRETDARQQVADLGQGEPPRILIDLTGHTIELTGFDLLLISTAVLLFTDAVITAVEVFG